MTALRIVLTLLCISVVGVSLAIAQDSTPDQQAMMEAYMKAATPGEIHAFFAKKAGSWKMHTKMWMEPGGPVMESDATAEVEMILGGRYLQEKVKGTSMGGPFEGMGITGYDNITGIVSSVWYDTMGTMTTILTGKYEKPGDPLELTGAMIDAMSGTEMTLRTVTTFVSDDEHRFDYYVTVPGLGEMKSMEMVYTRR